MTEKSVIDILLQNEIPKPQTKRIKMKRLSEHCGEPVYFTIKQLPYSRVAEIKNEPELSLHILLAGVVDPELKSKELQTKYDVPTPAELVKVMLLPGEIEDISREIEKLCGYRTATIELVSEIKKK